MGRLTIVFLVAALAGCAEEDDRPFGPGGGGGGGGGGGTSDAMPSATDAQPAGPSISGRLCLVQDLRDPLECEATTGLAGIVVELVASGATTTTASNGSFSLPTLEASSAQIKIAAGPDGYRDVLTVVPLAAGQALNLALPAIPDATWQSLLTEVGVAEPDDTASIATYIRQDDAPVVGAEVLPPAGSQGAPLYDGSSLDPNDWQSGGLTGPKGACIMLGVPGDAPTVSFEVSANADLQSFGGVPVLPNFLTFIPVALN